MDLTGIDIKYISEVKMGETINLYPVTLPDDQGFCPGAKDAPLLVGKHEEDQKTAFLSILYWDSPL